MHKDHIHDAAEAFLRNHANYIRKWGRAWLKAELIMTQQILDTIQVPVDFRFGPDLPCLGFATLTPQQVVTNFHLFWNELPDSPVIHGPAFDDLCAIAECIFDFDNDDDELALPS